MTSRHPLGERLILGLLAASILYAAGPSSLGYSDRRWIEKQALLAETNSKVYTDAELVTFVASSPYFTGGLLAGDTTYYISEDSTDTVSVYWNDDTLWFELNGGMMMIPSLSGYAPQDTFDWLKARVDTLDAYVDSLIAKTDTLQDIVDSLGAQRDTLAAGFIMLWHGNVGTIPAGWHLCDGTTGTPDLRDRFIIAAGGNYAVDSTGGADSVQYTVASHSHTSPGVNDTGHTHGVGTTPLVHPATGTPTAHVITVTNATTGITLDATTGSESPATDWQTNKPLYYALCYIMKL